MERLGLPATDAMEMATHGAWECHPQKNAETNTRIPSQPGQLPRKGYHVDSIRRLIIFSALIIETFGLGAPTRFATSSYTSYPSSPSREITKTHNGEGRTEYYADGGYQVYNDGSDKVIGTYFYRDNNPHTPVHFTTCTEGVGKSCTGNLPQDLLTGKLCMKTGVGRYEQPPNDYLYGDSKCFDVNPRTAGSPGG